MKNRIFTLANLLGLLVWPLLSWAQEPAANPSKIKIISIQEAIANTAEGKKALAEITKRFQPRQQDLQRQQQEIQALTDQLQKQATTLSDEEQRRLTRQLEEKQRIFKRATEDADADYRAEGQDVIQRIGRKMVPLINEYAQQNGLLLVIDPAAAQVPVYYLAKDIDITEEMVKRYDGANPVDTPATSTGGASPAAAPRSSSSAAKPAATPRPATASKPVDKPKQ